MLAMDKDVLGQWATNDIRSIKFKVMWGWPMDDRLKTKLKVAAIIAVIAFAILSDSERRSQKPHDISAENVGRQVGKRTKPFARGFIDGLKKSK